MRAIKLNLVVYPVLIFFICNRPVLAQQSKRPFFQHNKTESGQGAPDSLKLYPYKISRGNYYVLDGNLVFARTDSLVYVKDTNKVLFHQKGIERKDAFISALQEKSKGNIVTQGLYNQLVKPTPQIVAHSGQFNRSDLYFLPYNKKIIASITIKKIGIYGVTVQDTSFKSNNWYYKTLNKTHVNTHDSRIIKSLLFTVGNEIDPFILADNEKLLRSFPFIQDARIMVSTNPQDTTTADITVITQDAYPLVIGGTIYNLSNSRLDISNNNLLGMGQQFINKIYFNLPAGWEYNYNGQYKINNIGGTFINTLAEYYHVDQTEYTGLRVFRNFVTSNTLFAGSASWYRYNTNAHFNQLSDNDNMLVQNRIFDSWIGRNFPFWINNYQSGFTLTARYFDNYHISRPYVSIDSNINYLNIQRYLLRTGYYLTQSFKSNMIFSSGTTEDIPTGILFEAMAGFEQNDFSDRVYLGSSLTTGIILPRQFYGYLKMQAGTFINQNKQHTPAFSATGTFISPLIHTKIALFRQFLSFKYFGSKQGYLSQPIDLSIKGAIRDFPSKNPAGNYLLATRLETVYYPNLYYYGFGITYFSFLDIGTISKKQSQMLKNEAYTGIGAGLRIRNQNFVFNSVEIKLCWFPKLTPENTWAFFASSEQTLNLDRIAPGVPEIVEP